MKVAGVIAEYNPFHNGHKYQLEEIRKRTQADYIMVAMSGNFLQRGVPALVDKYTRAEFALSQGADLVFEIPALWATASAEYYASAGVGLLHSTQAVNFLCFGAETDQLPLLQTAAHVLNQESPSYQQALQEALRSGATFPKARILALEKTVPFEDSHTDFSELLSKPNNILALEYLRSLHRLKSDLEPCLIQRKGDAYHAKDVQSRYASATAIRQILLEKDKPHQLRAVLPPDLLHALLTYQEEFGFVAENSISAMLGYQLHCCSSTRYDRFADCSLDLSNRIYNNLSNYENFQQFCTLLKSRELTHSRISRVLLHILLQIREEDYVLGKDLGMIPYLRVLGFRRSSSELLGKIKRESPLPLITKLTEAPKQISTDALWMLEQDVFTSNIYNQLLLSNKKKVPRNDYSRELILL